MRFSYLCRLRMTSEYILVSITERVPNLYTLCLSDSILYPSTVTYRDLFYTRNDVSMAASSGHNVVLTWPGSLFKMLWNELRSVKAN